MKLKVGRENSIDNTYQCDICGEVSVYKVTCSICGRDMCSSCTFFDTGCFGNYTDKYCESCFNIGKEYFDRFKKEREKFDTIMEKIEREWKDRAIEAATQQKKQNI